MLIDWLSANVECWHACLAEITLLLWVAIIGHLVFGLGKCFSRGKINLLIQQRIATNKDTKNKVVTLWNPKWNSFHEYDKFPLDSIKYKLYTRLAEQTLYYLFTGCHMYRAFLCALANRYKTLTYFVRLFVAGSQRYGIIYWFRFDMWQYSLNCTRGRAYTHTEAVIRDSFYAI